LNKLIISIKTCLPDCQIILRPHPNTSLLKFKKSLLKNFSEIVISDSSKILHDSLDAIDLVIAGESSAHLEVLSLGIPSVYWRLDKIPYDHYGFVRNNFVLKVDHLFDLKNKVNSFYSSTEWKIVQNQYS
ncbi:MAG: hypothetical protein KDD45_13695, partial [Bdellovibrionales bacterium]|nr:hypothetical protein [Bdellovibrionales bacterium]